MDVQAELARQSVKRTAGLIDGDRRRHRRVQVALSGRFMRSNRDEHACTVKDLSVGGASIVTTVAPDPGERIIGYFEHIGGLDGTVVRLTADGFAFQYKVSEHKHDKLVAQMTWLINRDAYPDEAGRRHERIGTKGRKTTLQLDEGIVLDVDLLDVSVSGASVATSARPAIGEDVVVGKIPAVVRRHHAQGLGIQFLTTLADDVLRANFP